MNVEYLTVRDLIEQLQRCHPWDLTDVTDVRARACHLTNKRVFVVPGHPTKEEVADLDAKHVLICQLIAEARKRLDGIYADCRRMEERIKSREKRLAAIGRLVAQRKPILP